MHVCWTFTGDGLLAFAGGAFAIIAVLLSNRRSRINLQRQLDEEKKVRECEQKKQNRSIAIGILHEIDRFYEECLGGPLGPFETSDPQSMALPPMAIVGPQDFIVYRKAADKLGFLDEVTLRLVVDFYK